MDTSSVSTGYVGPPNDESPAPTIHDDGLSSSAIPSFMNNATTTTAQLPRPASISPSVSPADMGWKDTKSFGFRGQEDTLDSPDNPPLRLRPGRQFKGKAKESLLAVRDASQPLRLLDLPIDVLKDIVKEVTHTNDLTSLALTHSALHRLAVPHIYSRFDIVWPDTSTHAEARSGVDALTYGLATLVMAEEVFGEAPSQLQQRANRFNSSDQGHASEATIRRRIGNHYAQFTRKFSLGNGPPDWVQEYLITKEGGKMLGTLVALAVARMRSLESFIWDMPTGVIRDVWLALSSLGHRMDRPPSRLEKVWVRWHNNLSAQGPLPSPTPSSATAFPSNHLANPALHGRINPVLLNRVEHPTFSVLPALKSLSVLDIDELAYLDELAVLIDHSVHRLRELRIGIARHAVERVWTTVWEGENLHQVDRVSPTAGAFTIGEKRLGGILGILTGFFHNIRKPGNLPVRAKQKRLFRSPSSHLASGDSLTPLVPRVVPTPSITSATEPRDDGDVGDAILEDVQTASLSPNAATPTAPTVACACPGDATPRRVDTSCSPKPLHSSSLANPASEDKVLQLESLELERVPLSVPVLQTAIDWGKLTTLTFLHCQNHEAVWKMLRRTFAPRPKSPTYPRARTTPNSSPRKSGRGASLLSLDADLQYPLNLKKIHTSNVSPALISFLKETLRPNSLEVLFLQEGRNYISSVTIDAIFRGPLRRHRASLQKVLILSSDRHAEGLMHNSSSRWRKWMPSREILDFICSGKMAKLRELSLALDYRDWHFFLQSLPAIPHLRSLHIPHLADPVRGAHSDPRELALQIVDIIALRPDIELCYVGIANKCFEILENRPGGRDNLTELAADAGAAMIPILAHFAAHPHPPPPPAGGDERGVEDDDDDPDDVEDGVAIAQASGSESEMDDEGEDVEHGHGPVAVDAIDAADLADDDENHVDEDDDEEDEDEGDDDDDDDSDDSSASGRTSRKKYKKTTPRLRLREILFYDDKVAIFKARHGRL